MLPFKRHIFNNVFFFFFPPSSQQPTPGYAFHLIYIYIYITYIYIFVLFCVDRNLAIGIGIQNFPEGLAVSLPLRGAGFSTWKAFW